MKSSCKIINVFFISVIVFCISYFSADCTADNSSIVVEDFEKYSEGDNIFTSWLLRDDDKKNASGVYKVILENNNKFLSAKSSGNSIQIAKQVKWDIKKFPVLSWKWRAKVLPNAASEETRGKNDSGASVYVIFQKSHIPFLSWQYQPINVIKYVWSTGLPVGRVVYKEKTKLGKKIYEGYFYVVESGMENAGKWISEERNVLDDYKKVFGENPRYDPYLIAILTDSNDTKSSALADYDDIVVRRESDK